jgi:hypothetical protein
MKIIKEYSAEIYRVKNYATYFAKDCRGAEENRAAVTYTVPDSPMKEFLAAYCVLLPRAKISK